MEIASNRLGANTVMVTGATASMKCHRHRNESFTSKVKTVVCRAGR